MEIWLTSDTHFSHQKAFLYEPRGFSSATEMNQAIVDRWNSLVASDDIVYHLGDVCLSDNKDAIKYIKQLNGHIIWLRGNHCTVNRILEIQSACSNIHLLGDMDTSYATIIKSGKWSFYLSHYPTLTGNFNEKHLNQHLISLHGHTHQQTNFLQSNNPFLYHVGLDSHNCYPVNLEEIKAEIKNTFYQLKSDF